MDTSSLNRPKRLTAARVWLVDTIDQVAWNVRDRLTSSADEYTRGYARASELYNAVVVDVLSQSSQMAGLARDNVLLLAKLAKEGTSECVEDSARRTADILDHAWLCDAFSALEWAEQSPGGAL